MLPTLHHSALHTVPTSSQVWPAIKWGAHFRGHVAQKRVTLSKNEEINKSFAKGYGTGNSQAVTHPSTNPACSCLTSQIERDGVYSTEYGRIQ